jgi:SAM-dependent methyltransferase
VITPARVSAIAHDDMPFHNPLDESAVEALLAVLPLGPGDRVLDVGCGRGELLLRIAERSGAAGVPIGGLGIDSAAEQIATAREQAAARLPGAALAFEVADARTVDVPPECFAVAACVGSTHALGGLDGTLARLAGVVRPGGYLVVGEGYWAQPPGPDYLDALGATAGELTDFRGLLDTGERHGLSPVHVARTSEQAWARYEWTYVFNGDRYAREHPDEEGIELLLARVEAVRRCRILAATGGQTLGFALVVWRPSAQSSARPSIGVDASA